jgi:hypothetical protein
LLEVEEEETREEKRRASCLAVWINPRKRKEATNEKRLKAKEERQV